MSSGQPVDCRAFEEWIHAFQADEVSADERQRLQAHLDQCPVCARRLAVEDAFLRGLRKRLPRVPAPPGLETRIRAALQAEVPAARGGGWRLFRTPGFSLAAAALALALVLGPAALELPGGLRGIASPSVHVTRQVTVVDLQCDGAGRTLEQQRRCRHDQHFNALRVGKGAYWSFSLAQAEAREIVFDPAWRGHRVMVDGDFYPEISTIRLTGIRQVEPLRL